jgi:signal transduction histidine kinase
MARREGASVMFLIASVRSWPLSWKVPLLTAALMIGIAATISQVVLGRLASDQESNLGALTNAYLDGISAAVVQPVTRGDVWETFDALDRARTHYTGVAARYVIVELPDKRVLAASEPLQRMLRPLGTLTRYFERVREGRAEPIPEGDQSKISAEFRRLFDRFNAMARALNEREALAARLAAQEKLAVLGKLASAMAHEVNNPLGGIFNALDTLRRHGADPGVRDSTLNLLHRGLSQIRKVVRSTIVTYRPEGFCYGLAPADVDDLRMLVEPEAARKNLVLEWRNEVADRLPLAAGSVRQATLNLLLNACAASPPGGKVDLLAKVKNEALVVEIADAGPGLPSALAAYLVGEGEAATLPGDGLGLWIVRRLVGGERGSIEVVSAATQGTTVRVTWPFSEDPAAKDGDLPATAEDFAHAG